MSVRSIIPRKTWGAAQPIKTSPKTTWHRNTEVWIHHTEYPTLSSNATLSQEQKRMRDIQNLHIVDRRWDDIGYNYIIMPSGRVYEGRGKNVIGSHATDENDKPGISFDGKFNSVLPTKEALKSLSWLLDELNLTKNNFKGHREYSGGKTDCPGDALFNYIKKEKLPSWEGGSEESNPDVDSSTGTSTGAGYTFPKGVASNEVFRQIPMSTDDPFAAGDLQNPQNYYNTLDPNFKQSSTSKFLAADAYFDGGVYDVTNRCSFTYVGVDKKPRSITLLVPPTGISWNYSLRTKIEDTYGGQVIQILGVQIDNFKLSGYIPTGIWGRDNDYIDESNLSYAYFEGANNAHKNGIMHVANFFRDFFAHKSQGSFMTDNMQFSYPHYGWVGPEKSIKIIPYEFPRVRVANDEILPEWEMECSLVEFLSSHFVSKATTAAKNQLNYLPSGIGFAKFIEWSDPTATTDISIVEEAKSLGASYANFVKEFNAEESDSLAQAGFSYPPEIIDRPTATTKEIQQIIQDRFGENIVSR